MKPTIKLILSFYLILSIFTNSIGSENFFDKGLKLFNDKKYEDAKFMFERSIVFNPKDSNSYLYLAKIYNQQKKKKRGRKKFRCNTLN